MTRLTDIAVTSAHIYMRSPRYRHVRNFTIAINFEEEYFYGKMIELKDIVNQIKSSWLMRIEDNMISKKTNIGWKSIYWKR